MMALAENFAYHRFQTFGRKAVNRTILTAFASAVIGLGAATSPAHAQDAPMERDQSANPASEQTALEVRADQVVAVVNGDLAAEDVFSDSFLAAVSPEQLTAISQQLTSQFGAALSVEELSTPQGTRSSLAIRMERAIARGGIAIDPASENRISELLFQTFDPINDDASKIEADLAALPGDVSVLFASFEEQAPVLASEWGDQMAIGSTFKLYVLAALACQIADGERQWSDVVTLSDTRSFPSGMMQDWPKGAEVTLETLASMMISISDNTATDALIELLGTEVILETMADSRHADLELNDPFLTTRQMFLLKGGPDARLEAYRSGDVTAKAAILAELEEVVVTAEQVQAAFATGPKAIDVEWFASASDLAGLYRYMREQADPKAFEIMGINPSVSASSKERWSYVGYKGGSEPGVLNLTWFLTDKAGADHVLVLSWNNPEANLDHTALELIAQRILSLE